MFKHILVPLDSSSLAETALPYAQQIIADNGRITLLMVLDASQLEVPVPSVGFQVDPILEKALKERDKTAEKHANDYLDRIITTIKNKSLELDKVVQVGNPTQVIVEVANSFNVDAIVMSTHGRTGLSRLLLGSVTQKVLSLSTCPILVIPQQK